MARILVVEDESDIRTIVELALDDHECHHAVDGKEALEILAKEDMDLVILDWMMPELDGPATLRRIRQNPDTRGIRVIMLTAKATESDHLQGFQVGADAFLTKPFDLDDLRDLVDDVLGRSDVDRERRRAEEIDKANLLRQIERRFE